MTKEMLLGPLSKFSISPLVINYNSVECICGFKLLGVYISLRPVLESAR